MNTEESAEEDMEAFGNRTSRCSTLEERSWLPDSLTMSGNDGMDEFLDDNEIYDAHAHADLLQMKIYEGVGRAAHVPMTSHEIALDIAASPFPFLPLQLQMTSNNMHPTPGGVWVIGMQMGETTAAGGTGKNDTFWRVMWIVFFPLILVWHSIRIYFLPCLGVYANRFFGTLCLTVGKTLCCLCTCKFWLQQKSCLLCEFEDPDFPPSGKSIGKWKGKSEQQLNDIKWARASSLTSNKSGEKVALFHGGITASDIAQGQLGDCWLMAALACLAENPTSIQKCFVTRERNVRGCYVLELYDGREKKFKRITVDDYLPADGGKPLFANPNGSELWVLLLEKAMAKLFGAYGKLDGGCVGVAFEALTGDNVLYFALENGKWVKYALVHHTERGSFGQRKVVPEEAYNDVDFFEILQIYDQLRSVVGAGSTQGRSDSAADSKNGICQGHAYSVIKTAKAGTRRMLQLRNPWGSFEWKGAWGDSSPLWAQHADVARACGRSGEQKDDGVFWMELGDFSKNFDQIDICHRATGLQDLRLSTHEDEGCLGPTKGCVCGCGAYYLCCQGPMALCCPQESSVDTKKPQGCCRCCPYRIVPV